MQRAPRQYRCHWIDVINRALLVMNDGRCPRGSAVASRFMDGRSRPLAFSGAPRTIGEHPRMHPPTPARGAARRPCPQVCTAPRSPWQSGYAERIIGSIRRESRPRHRPDRVRAAPHPHRVHGVLPELPHAPGLAKDTPISRPVSAIGSIVAVPHVGGLHHRYDQRTA